MTQRKEEEIIKKRRFKALYTLEQQRGDVQQALFEMSVWNTFDPDMIREMFDKKP